MAGEHEEEYLTVDQACNLLGVKRATLYSYVSRGLLHSYKQGIRRQRLYRRSEVESLLEVRPGAEAEAEASEHDSLPSADDWVGDR